MFACVATMPGVPLRASGSDALVLGASAGGERRSGVVASCDAERCFLDRTAVALADVAWLGLGVGEDAPPTGVPARGVVLADGTVRPGRLLGLSLGSVLLDTEELDRTLVRWVRVAEVRPPVDVLVRRDGAARTGELQGCAGGLCTMAGQTTARDDLAWIGLGVDPERIQSPEPPQDPARDLLRLADGSSLASPLVGVGANDVVAGVGTFSRGEVAWIYLAPPADSPEPPVVNRRPPPPGAPPVEPPRPPRPPPPVPAPPGAGGAGPGERFERGGLWTGTITGRHVTHLDPSDDIHEWSCQATARLREWILPMHEGGGSLRRIGRIVRLAPEGTVMFNRTSCRGEYIAHCGGEGSIDLSYGPEEVAQASVLYLKDVDVDATPALGFDVPREGGLYVLGIAVENSQTFLWTITNTLGDSSTHDHGYGCFLQGNAPLLTENMDPQRRSLQGGRMVGSYSTNWHYGTLDVSWSLCREGDACPPPAPLPPAGDEPEPEPCGDLAAERALVDVLWDQRQSYAADLEAEWHALELAHGEMLDNVEAYRAAIGACAIWDIVSETLESASGWAGEFTEFGTKVLSGDLSAFVGEEPWKSLAERAWDVFPRESTWAGLMRDRVSGCSAPIPPDLRAAALRFVDSWERVRELMPSVQEKLNRIRDQDLRYWEKWQRFYQTCLRWAACKGLPPSSCPQPPEQPSGPMPPAPPS